MSTAMTRVVSRPELRGLEMPRIQAEAKIETGRLHDWTTDPRHQPNPRSVGLFVDSFTPVMDGVTVTVQNYAHWLARTLGPTFVVAPRVPGHVDRECFDVIRFLSLPTVIRQPYRVGFPALDGRLKALLKSRDFSIAHAHSPFGAGRTALAAGRERGVPVVATFHSKFRENLLQSIPLRRVVDAQVKRIVDFLYSVDQVWIPQQSVAATLRDYGYQGPYEVVENGTDFAPSQDTSQHRARGGRDLGVPEEAPVGLFVGQMVYEKNLELLLASLVHVIARLPDFRMVLVGEGYATRHLRKLAQELGIQDNLTFHGAEHDREVLKALYARADLLLFPSLYDNAPLVVRESAAMKTPAVLIRGATAAEVIRDGQNGFLAEGSVEAFAHRVVEVVENETLRKRAGLQAQRTLCRSWENVAMEIRGRYLSILSEWRG